MNRHVVLVGLPGAGKSTVGSLLAGRMGRRFVDLDDRIVERVGASVPDIFRVQGEEAFRVLERDTMAEALAGPPVVVAPGGGWAAQHLALESVRGRAVVVYLQLPPDVAAIRVAGGEGRPLLTGHDPAARVRELYERRRPWYERADVTVDAAEGTPDQVAARVAAALVNVMR